MAETFSFFPTRNSREPGLSVDVQMGVLKPSDIPAIGTPLRNCEAEIRKRIPSAWHDYVFTEVTKGPPGFCTFKFVAVKTVSGRNTPFEEFVTYRQWTWPAVLYSLKFYPDERFPQSASAVPKDAGTKGKVFRPTWYARRIFKDETTYSCRCIVRRFLSDASPFSDEDVDHMQPVAGVIEWDFNGASGGMRCLHPDIAVPSHGRVYTVSYDATASAAIQGRNMPERHFPATNFEDWAPFILEDAQVQENGQWYREQVEIFPPPEPELSDQ